jgi:hypothetical protein
VEPDPGRRIRTLPDGRVSITGGSPVSFGDSVKDILTLAAGVFALALLFAAIAVGDYYRIERRRQVMEKATGQHITWWEAESFSR